MYACVCPHECVCGARVCVRVRHSQGSCRQDRLVASTVRPLIISYMLIHAVCYFQNTHLYSVPLTAASFVLCVGGWFYTRLWVLPNDVIRAVFNSSVGTVYMRTELGWGAQAFGVLLSALVFLHIFWMYLVREKGVSRLFPNLFSLVRWNM